MFFKDNIANCYNLNKSDFKSYSEISIEEEKKMFLRNNKDEILKFYLPFVILISKKFFNKGVEKNDIIQTGILGLYEAIDRFDINKGVKFLTYAVWWIKTYIKNLIYNNRLIPPGLYIINPGRSNKILKDINEIAEKIGHKPTIQEIAKASSLSVKRVKGKIRYLEERKFFLSCKIIFSDDFLFLCDKTTQIIDSNRLTPEEYLILKEEINKINVYFENLKINPPNLHLNKEIFARNIDIFKKFCGIDSGDFEIGEHTKKEIGDIYGLSKENIRQIIKFILKIILEDLEKNNHDYLNIIKSIFDNEETDKKIRTAYKHRNEVKTENKS